MDRVPWVDVAKGLGIVLVVVGHVFRGLDEFGLTGDRAMFLAVDRLIYAFHMPLFFFLAGLFFPHGVVGQTPPSFVWHRILRLVNPLILWGYAFALVKIAVGDLANSPEGWGALLASPLPPRWHLWFLWALFVIQIGCLLLRPLLMRLHDTRPVWTVALCIATIAYLLPELRASPWIAGAVSGAPFFLMGALLGQRSLSPPVWLAVPAVAVFLFAELAALVLNRTHLLDLTIASAAVLSLVLALSALQSRMGILQRGFSAFGRASMPIFLVHVFFTAGLRIVLAKFGVDDLATHLVLGTAAGLVGPLALYHLLCRTGHARLAGF